MSRDIWAYTPEICDGDYCPKDCDKCPKSEDPFDEARLKKMVIALRQCARTDCGDCLYLDECLAGSRAHGYVGSEPLLHDAAVAIERLLRRVKCED